MLLTRERINALSRISRFAGWTERTYCVLEHSVIGAVLLAEAGYDRAAQQSFLLHDVHETQFGGDITSPVKKEYMPNRYHLDVAAWDAELSRETRVPLNVGINDRMDAIMAAAEMRTIFTGTARAMIPDGCRDAVFRAMALIRCEDYAGKHSVEAFWQMWAGE
jgi:hypothetical protein